MLDPSGVAWCLIGSRWGSSVISSHVQVGLSCLGYWCACYVRCYSIVCLAMCRIRVSFSNISSLHWKLLMMNRLWLVFVNCPLSLSVSKLVLSCCISSLSAPTSTPARTSSCVQGLWINLNGLSRLITMVEYCYIDVYPSSWALLENVTWYHLSIKLSYVLSPKTCAHTEGWEENGVALYIITSLKFLAVTICTTHRTNAFVMMISYKNNYPQKIIMAFLQEC